MTETNKALMALVLGMGIILLIGLGALIMGLVIETKKPETSFNKDNPTSISTTIKSMPHPTETVIINIPEGFQIGKVISNPRQIILHIKNDRGNNKY